MSKNHMDLIRQALLMMIAGIFSSAAMPLDIYQAPLVAERSMDPNVIYIHDGSGSMTREYMPDEAPSGGNLRRSSFLNRQYYNPDVTYEPPLKYEDGKLVSWGNIDQRCKWPIVLNNGFAGARNSCTPPPLVKPPPIVTKPSRRPIRPSMTRLWISSRSPCLRLARHTMRPA